MVDYGKKRLIHPAKIAFSILMHTTKQNISLHIKNVFEDGELAQKATVKESLTLQKEGDPYLRYKH